MSEPVIVQIVFWRAIPAQVKVKAGRARVAQPLSARFQEAIDAAAMKAGLIGTDDYLAEWHTSDPETHSGDPASVAAARAAELETAYPDERLKQLIRIGGLEASTA